MRLQSLYFFALTEMPSLSPREDGSSCWEGWARFSHLFLPNRPPRARPHGGCWALCSCDHLSGAALASRTKDTSPTCLLPTAGSAWTGPTHVPAMLPSVCDCRITAPMNLPGRVSSAKSSFIQTDSSAPKLPDTGEYPWVSWPSASLLTLLPLPFEWKCLPQRKFPAQIEILGATDSPGVAARIPAWVFVWGLSKERHASGSSGLDVKTCSPSQGSCVE